MQDSLFYKQKKERYFEVIIYLTYSDILFINQLVLSWTVPTRGLLAVKGTFITLDIKVIPEKIPPWGDYSDSHAHSHTGWPGC